MEATEQQPTETEPYHPRANPDFQAHEDAEKSLLADINAGRLPHALILAGPAGIGKATLAFRLARYLLTNSGEPQEAGLFGDDDTAPVTSLYVDPQHPQARRLASGGHADVLTIERPYDEQKGRQLDTIPVDEVRKITPFLRKTAAEGGWRIVIVDGAESLNRAGQNALLKILEEPPEQALLILTTNQPGAFLPTIRSRCRILNLKPLGTEIVVDLLSRLAPELNATDCRTLAHLSEGSIGEALSLYQEGGLDMYHMVLDSLKPLPEINPVQIFELGEKLGRKGAEKSYQSFTKLLCWWLARMARYQSRGQLPDPVVPEEQELLTRLANIYGPKAWLELWEEIGTIIREAENASLDKRQTLLRVFKTFER